MPVLDADVFGRVFLIDRDTGLEHGPCSTVSAREILEQKTPAVDGAPRYVTKDDYDGKPAVTPAPVVEQAEPVKSPAAPKKPVDAGSLS